MTVGELKEKLEQFPDDLLVGIPDIDRIFVYTLAKNVTRGVNECDGYVFIDDYVED